MATTSESPEPSFSSTSTPEFKGRYDIFLSFRGSDTRRKFTDHLYHALMHEGFQTFRDDDEIERGEDIKTELLEAIENSKMSVVVLSPNYSNSTACLFELQKILELGEKPDRFVLPVFYEVEPSVLKKQSMNLVFENKEVPIEKLKGWSAALKEVASMAGMVFDGTSSYEAKFIKEIVGVLKGKQAYNHQSVDDHLVGMDSRTERVSCWLKDSLSGVGILSICGMGGIGKTAIAKVVYDSSHHNYDAACFLENVRGVSRGHKGLVDLQRHLLSDILGKNERINNVDDGCYRIKYALSNKRILLVLDDVDDMDQLLALAGQQDWFTPGSRIVITTRIESMVSAYGTYELYRPEKLSHDESLQLFSWHAFGQKHPIEGHVDLSEKFVQHCDGLPLALKVIGSSLRRKDIDVWESKLQNLEATSYDTILEKLKISFDSLDGHDQNLFLDIACFFAGKKKNETITILEGCGYSAPTGIHNLVDKNLLTIVNAKLQMHKLLQDMGNQIVCRESKCPEKRSRIWCPKESFNILVENIGTENIEGLALDMNTLGNSNTVVFEAKAFEKMYNLRLLKLSGVKLSGTFEVFPKKIRWLYWHGFPSESFPNDFPLENLVSLDMRYSNLKQVWKGTKVLGLLKNVYLSHSRKLVKTPNFSRIPNLENLVLKACPSLVEVHESIVELHKIKSLNLQDCKKLRKLPKNIGMLESLIEINISGCSNLTGAMEELGKMKSLQMLNASGMEVVSPASIWPWVPKPRVQVSLSSLPSSLVHLNLSDCNLTDDAFPMDLKLHKLQHLFLGGNPISSLPNFLKDLTCLQTLDLTRCPKLQQIQWSTGILLHLNVTKCDALEKITFEPGADIRGITHPSCSKLYYVQDRFKFLPVREVDVELLNGIGFFNLNAMADTEVTIMNCLSCMSDKRPVQIVYEDHAFSTYFPGGEVPHWFSNKNGPNGRSTISFRATLSSHFSFRGMNLCLVYTQGKESEDRLQFVINNKTSGRKTICTSTFIGVPEKGGYMVWLCHCFQANLFREGDEVEVSFKITEHRQIKECGVHLLYFEEDGEVFQYVSSIQHSWDPNLSLYVPVKLQRIIED